MTATSKDNLLRILELTQNEVDALTAEVNKLKWEVRQALAKTNGELVFTANSLTLPNQMGLSLADDDKLVFTKNGTEVGSITY